MRRWLFWGLLPLALPQALWVRRTAPRFAGASGPSVGITDNSEGLADQTRSLMVIGDSVAAGIGASSHQHSLVGQTAQHLALTLQATIQWRALGKIGATTQQIADQLLPQLPSHAIDFFVVSAGVNDVTSLTTRRRFGKALKQLLTALQLHSPQSIIAVAGLPPFQRFPLLPQPLRTLMGMRGKLLNSVMQEIILNQSRIVFVPVDFDAGPDRFAADGFHPSERSYQDFGQAMAVALTDHFLGLTPAAIGALTLAYD